MLPHVADRPLSLVRAVGRTGKRVLARRGDDLASDAVGTVPVAERDGVVVHATIHDERGLVALVEAFALEIQASPARTSDLEHPDRLVFELEPGEGVHFGDVAQAARLVRALFQGLDLESFVMTRGHRGLDVIVPIEPELDWDTVRRFADTVSDGLVAAAPARYGAAFDAEPRTRIHVRPVVEPGATFVAPYSTQLLSNAPVALPAFWYEIEQLDPDAWTPAEVVERLNTLPNDPWERMSRLEQRLTLVRRTSLAKALHRALGG
jgi:bifunctional non-homologous end joining protein LigD